MRVDGAFAFAFAFAFVFVPAAVVRASIAAFTIVILCALDSPS
jgi:hypothetical protein